MTMLDTAQERGGTRAHRRQEGEYVGPETALRAVSWEEARDVSLYEGGKLTGKRFFWAGVRGSQFVDGALWPHAIGVEHELWGELVPEPYNPYDHTAVAVDVDEIRAGYMPSRAASIMHRHVAALVATGSRVLTPVRFSIVPTESGDGFQVDAFAAYPTYTGIERYLPSQAEYLKILSPLWDQLDGQVHQQIAEDRFHLTEETLAAVVALRDLAPRSGLTKHTHLKSVPRGVELFLEAARHRHKRDKRAGEEEEREAQLRRMLVLRTKGHTFVEIGRLEGVSPSTVSKRLKAAGYMRKTAGLQRRGSIAKTSIKAKDPSQNQVTQRRPIPLSVIRTMQTLHKNGWTAERLARDHGRDLAEITAALARDVSPRSR